MKLPASYSVICASSLLEQVAPLYDIDVPEKCEFWYRGLNDTYKLLSSQGVFALRVYRHGWRTSSDIGFELNALAHLHEKGGKVAYPIPRFDGRYETKIDAPEGERIVIITSFVGGSTLSYENLDDAEAFGKSAAQIHNLTNDFETNHVRYKLDEAHLIWVPVERIEPFLSDRKEDWDYIQQLSDRLADSYKTVANNEPERFCHGDFHGFNAHQHNQEIYHFDFDCCGLGLRLFDLATFKWSARLRKKEEEWWPCFLNGYQAVREIEINLDQIEAFVAIRHLWLLGLHAGMSRDFARGWLNRKYIDNKIEFLKEAELKIE